VAERIGKMTAFLNIAMVYYRQSRGRSWMFILSITIVSSRTKNRLRSDFYVKLTLR